MKKYLYLTILSLFFCSACVVTNQPGSLENRVSTLEAKNNPQIDENRIDAKYIMKLEEAYATLKAEISKYRETIRKLKGIIEETGHKLSILDTKTKNSSRTEKIEELNIKASDNSKRIVELEHYTGIESKKDKGPDPVKADIEKANEDPETVYKQAKNLLDQEKYDASRLEFEKFINLFPDSKNVDNARFWIADTYYKEKWYEKAILEYQKVIEKYSTGNKVAAALLKQGFAFAELGEMANARLILKELVKKHPDSSEAILAQKKLESLKK